MKHSPAICGQQLCKRLLSFHYPIIPMRIRIHRQRGGALGLPGSAGSVRKYEKVTGAPEELPSTVQWMKETITPGQRDGSLVQIDEWLRVYPTLKDGWDRLAVLGRLDDSHQRSGEQGHALRAISAQRRRGLGRLRRETRRWTRLAAPHPIHAGLAGQEVAFPDVALVPPVRAGP